MALVKEENLQEVIFNIDRLFGGFSSFQLMTVTSPDTRMMRPSCSSSAL